MLRARRRRRERAQPNPEHALTKSRARRRRRERAQLIPSTLSPKFEHAGVVASTLTKSRARSPKPVRGRPAIQKPTPIQPHFINYIHGLGTHINQNYMSICILMPTTVCRDLLEQRVVVCQPEDIGSGRVIKRAPHARIDSVQSASTDSFQDHGWHRDRISQNNRAEAYMV